jgi:electron transfer flavoprotein beta subunit
MMNIAVLIKQVPRTEKIKIDRENGTLIRTGVESILNPYCEYALDMAVAIKKRLKDVKITVFTMGPDSAELALRRALSLGADEAVLVSDRAFAGSDCWATAYTLSEAMKHHLEKADLIICGKQAIDGDTAQVPGEISEIICMPLLPYVYEIIDINESIEVKCEIGDNILELSSKLPVVITAGNGSNIRRIPSVKEAAMAYSSDIVRLDNSSIKCDLTQTGLKGSPTRVVKIETVTAKGKCEFHNEENLDKGLNKLLDFISIVKGDKI